MFGVFRAARTPSLLPVSPNIPNSVRMRPDCEFRPKPHNPVLREREPKIPVPLLLETNREEVWGTQDSSCNSPWLRYLKYLTLQQTPQVFRESLPGACLYCRRISPASKGLRLPSKLASEFPTFSARSSPRRAIRVLQVCTHQKTSLTKPSREKGSPLLRIIRLCQTLAQTIASTTLTTRAWTGFETLKSSNRNWRSG